MTENNHCAKFLGEKGMKKVKLQKQLNSEEHSKWKVPNQLAKSNDKLHQTNGQLALLHRVFCKHIRLCKLNIV